MKNPRFLTLTSMIAIAALSRLIPHAWNFTPVAAMALFGGAQFSKRREAFLVPLAALFLSDLILGFHSTMLAVYLCFAITVLIGRQMHGHISVGSVVGGSLISSVMFFVVTNFACWLTMAEYTKDLSGLGFCYTQALPFFRNTLLGDLVFNGVLFGSFAWSQKTFPQLRTA